MDSPISRKKQIYLCQCDFAHIRSRFFSTFFNTGLWVPCSQLLKTDFQHLSTLKPVNRL